MTRLFLATTNPAKQQTLQWATEGFGFAYHAAGDRAGTREVEERGAMFIENAVQKAVSWSEEVPDLVVATDGGMAIPALGERWNPLETHRFAGPDASDEDRVRAVLDLLRPYRGKERYVYWTEAVAFAKAGKKLAAWEVRGDEGHLAESYKPEHVIPGFWTAAIWLSDGFDRVYAELTEEERHLVPSAWQRLKPLVQGFLRNSS
ncbi:MAG: hypothetical protein HY341_00300 [Candidatus Kerfeldbacteria bacterium]|nr:hypothetical protein [Candidatus Kerfeldbacteria bacterium]